MMTDKIEFTTDQERLDFEMIFEFLSATYWAKGLSRSRLKRAIENSLNVGAYKNKKLVGYARIITDQATYAYLCDVFVVEEERGRGVSKEMMKFIIALPQLHGIKRFALVTKDAQGLYRQFGFENMPEPAMYMEINRGGYTHLQEA